LEDARQALARRLRALREQHWPGHSITQHQLAEALGGRKPLSISLISSWESQAAPAVPPIHRLNAYASFFATPRSVASEPYRVLPPAQLTDDERTVRDGLLHELTDLRMAALQGLTSDPGGSSLWTFPDHQIVTIVCAQLPDSLLQKLPYTDPESPDYVALYTYADLDALIELHGHVRAVNPATEVRFKTAIDLLQDDYTSHLVLLGGVDWNLVTRDVLQTGRVELPVRQEARDDRPELNGFKVHENGSDRFFGPQLDGSGQLLEDVAHFYRGPNPFNFKRTVTICNGMYGRGTLGAVRALTDARFRDRNDAYIRHRFGPANEFSILSRVLVVRGQVVTPDWTAPDTRLHEWPGKEQD
jgi:transcriptional regulator with XRE-family HTH domain